MNFIVRAASGQLVAGSNITLTRSATGITIASSGGGGTGSANQVARFSGTNTIAGSTVATDDLLNYTYVGTSFSVPVLYLNNVGPSSPGVIATGGITNVQTTVPLTSATGYPIPTTLNPVILALSGGQFGPAEYVICTTLTTNTYSGCTRGAYNTSGQAFSAGASAYVISELEAASTTSTPYKLTFFKGMTIFTDVGANAEFFPAQPTKSVGFDNIYISGQILGLGNSFELAPANFGSNDWGVLFNATKTGIDSNGILVLTNGTQAVTSSTTTLTPTTPVLVLTGSGGGSGVALTSITPPANSACVEAGGTCQITVINTSTTSFTVTGGSSANNIATTLTMAPNSVTNFYAYPQTGGTVLWYGK